MLGERAGFIRLLKLPPARLKPKEEFAHMFSFTKKDRSVLGYKVRSVFVFPAPCTCWQCGYKHPIK